MNGDTTGLESEPGDFDVQLVDDAGESPFSFSDGEAAGGEGGTGDGVAADEREFFDREDPVFVEELIDFGLIGGVNIAEDEALEGSESDFHSEAIEDRAESGFDAEVTDILDTSIFDVDAEEQTSVALLMPAEVIIDIGNVGGVGFGEGATVVFFDFGFEGGDTPVGDEVFESCAFAVFAVTEISLDFNDGFADGDDVFGGGEGDAAGECGECFFGGRSAAHSAACKHVVADDATIFDNDEQTEVLRIEVDAVVFREADGHFEFTGQVMRAVDGFIDGFEFCDVGFGAVVVSEPDVKVGGGFGAEVFGDFEGEFLNLIADGVIANGSGASHDVAVDVAAGGEGREFNAVDFANGIAEVGLENSVKLQSLSAGDPECAIGELVAEVEFGKELCGSESAAGDACADHAAVLLTERFAVVRFGFAGIAVVLEIGAVMFEDGGGVVGEFGAIVGKFFDEGAAELPGRLFEGFDFAHGRELGS